VQVLATSELPATARQILASIGEVSISAGALADELTDAEVLVVRAEAVDEELIRAARRLRVIARTGSGVDNVDVRAATALGIPVINAPDAGTAPVAEGSWALIFAAAKRLGELQTCIREDRWHLRYAIEGLDLRGSVLGVIGLGLIGREVARIGDAMGMRVLGFDAMLADDVDVKVPLVRTDLHTLMRKADVLTLHCALNDSTRAMIDRGLLQLTTRQPILVNAARGAVVDGDDLLLEALDRGWLSGVGLDVFAAEPLDPSSPLLSDPRIVCTPHSIGLTRNWNERVFSSLAHDIRCVLDGEQPRNIVNPEVLEQVGSA
jgi:D-3-phosphoglycerate dehydrogenase